MDFFSQKLTNYKIYTQQSYHQLAHQLDVHYSTLYNVIQNPEYPTIKRKILNNFSTLIEEIRSIENITTPWIDLFLPRIPGAAYAFFLYHEDCWATTEKFEDVPPIMSNGKYEYTNSRNLFVLRSFGLPRFPVKSLPSSVSLYKQTEEGWVQVHRVSESVIKFESYYQDALITHRSVSIRNKPKLKHY